MLRKLINYLLLILLFTLPFQTRWIYGPAYLGGGYWEYGTLSWYATEILLWLIVLLFVCVRWNDLRHTAGTSIGGLRSWRLAAAVLFLFFNIVVVTQSISPDISWQYATRALGAICLALIIYQIRDKHHNLIKAFWLGAVLQGGWAIMQFIQQKVTASTLLGVAQHIPWELGASVVETGDSRWLRAYGAFGSPNSLGIYLAVALVIGLVALIKLDKATLGKRWFWIAGVSGQIIILLGLILSFSRAAWLGSLAGVVIVLIVIWREFERRNLIARHLRAYLLLIIFSLTLLTPLFLTRFELASGRLERISLIERRDQYGEVGGLLTPKNLLWGVGPGAYTAELYKVSPTRPAWQYQPLHNIYLLFFTEWGVVNFIAVLFLGYWFVKYIWRLDRVLLAPLVVLAIFGLFDHWLSSMFSGVILSAVVLAFSSHFLPLENA